MNKYPKLESRSIQAMRAVNLLSDAGTYTEEAEGAPNYGVPQRFVRCAGTIDRKGLSLDRAALEEIAANIREATGDPAEYVLVSYHPDYGDYLRLRVESAAYKFLCYMKS